MIKKKKFERRFITALMKKGNYIKAEKLFYTLINRLKTNGIKNPYFFLRKAFLKITPIMSVFSKKKGSKDFYYLKYLDQRSADKVAIKWLLEQIGNKKSSHLITQIELELKKAIKNKGEIIAKKWELYKTVRFAALKAPKGKQKVQTFEKKKKKQLTRKKWF